MTKCDEGRAAPAPSHLVVFFKISLFSENFSFFFPILTVFLHLILLFRSYDVAGISFFQQNICFRLGKSVLN